ncbi:interleukin-4 receptor subunit alpha [Sceloporus undulatus]|uniref:interleukin-4 receptor subunit alpha n=1 Tax=Sceloporus undulatus TaxID=8520 RepID=UPI001C4B019C|nr:interleukin-4 receptor subunit alpha [Sceloporus undulatus]
MAFRRRSLPPGPSLLLFPLLFALRPAAAAATPGGSLSPLPVSLGPLPPSPSSGGPSPFCHTDFASVLQCSWETGPEVSARDCATDFRLRHSAHGGVAPPRYKEAATPALPTLSLSPPRQPPEEKEEAAPCGPEEPEEAGSPGLCSCAFRSDVFRLVQFRLALERREAGGRWRTVWSRSLEPEGVVKPRALVNLTAEKTDRSFVLSWRWDYPPESYLWEAKAEYQVAFWPKGQEGQVISTTSSTASYEIFGDRLLPASDYVAKVRFRLEVWGNLWSKWSAPLEWHNEFGEEPWKLTLWSCIPIVAVLLTCYLSITRVKRDWWDQIPSPAKSKMAQSMMMFPIVRKIPCKARTFLLGSSQGDGKDSLSKTAAATVFAPSMLQEVVPGSGGNPGPKPEIFLTPEVAVVECPLVICSRAAEAKPECWKEEAEEEQILRQDMVACLFQDLLNGEFSTGDARVLEAPATGCWGDLGNSGGLALGRLPGAPNFPPGASSESGYQSSGGTEAVLPPPLESPTGPECDSGQDCTSPSLDTHNYRSISSLVTQPVATSSHVEDPPYSSQTQPCSPPPELQDTLPASPGTLWLSTAAPTLAPQQGGSPGLPTWVVPGKLEGFSCHAASLLSGYHSFTSALQDRSPAQEGDSYKPLLSLLRSNDGGPFPLEGSLGAEGAAWPEDPCHPRPGLSGAAGGGREG